MGAMRRPAGVEQVPGPGPAQVMGREVLGSGELRQFDILLQVRGQAWTLQVEEPVLA